MPGDRTRVGQRAVSSLFVPAGLLAVATWVLPAASASSRLDRDPPRLEVDSVGTTEGHVQLVWDRAPEEGLEYELQEAGSEDFGDALVRYRGPQMRSFVSGLLEGTWYFRLRSREPGGDWSAWSEPVEVVIEPHDLNLAWTLFGVGAFLVTSIVGFLFVADWRVRASEREPSGGDPPGAEHGH